MQVFNSPPTLPYYSQPGPMTSPGRHAALLHDLPGDVAGLAGVLHGLVIHEHLAELYGVTLAEEDRASVHVRRTEDLLGLIDARDSRPLSVPREPAARLPGNCRHFTVFMVAMLRRRVFPRAPGAGSAATSATGCSRITGYASTGIPPSSGGYSSTLRSTRSSWRSSRSTST